MIEQKVKEYQEYHPGKTPAKLGGGMLGEKASGMCNYAVNEDGTPTDKLIKCFELEYNVTQRWFCYYQ